MKKMFLIKEKKNNVTLKTPLNSELPKELKPDLIVEDIYPPDVQS